MARYDTTSALLVVDVEAADAKVVAVDPGARGPLQALARLGLRGMPLYLDPVLAVLVPALDDPDVAVPRDERRADEQLALVGAHRQPRTRSTR